MVGDQYIIRQSKRKQIGFVVLSGFSILWYFVGPYEDTRIMYDKSPRFTIILGIIFFGLFFYSLSELIKGKAEITLTKDGIELRDKGFFEWEMIEGFSTIYYRGSENHSQDLVLHFKEFRDLQFDITHLEKEKDQIAELIIEYKGTANIVYKGHTNR